MYRKMVLMLRTIKSPYSIIFLLFMIIIFLLLRNSSNPTTTAIVKARQLRAHSADSRNNELIQILSKITMEDRTVIITVVGQEWARPDSILDLFLESFRIGEGTKTLLNHLLIVAFDDNAFQYCKSVHPHCLNISDYAKTLAINKRHIKYKLLQEVNNMGYNIVFTEAEVMWLRNPLLHADVLKDLTIACDYSVDPSGISNKIDGGFFFMKWNKVTVEYCKYWSVQRFLFPNSANRSLCEETIVNENIIQMIDLRIQYMDQDLFGRFCQQTINVDTICTVRANCCDDIENKVHDLKLLLADWRNENLPTRAPRKCKG